MEVPLVPPMRLWLLATAFIAMACSSQRAPEAPARAPDRFIYVSAQDVPSVCYHDLGGVTFTEPFTSAAMDGDGVQMANQLRALAMEKYPNEADAVINVHTQQNDVGTIVTVAGEVVELQHAQTVECAMRKAPGVLDRTAAVAAGGMLGAVAGGLIPGAGTIGLVGGAAAGAGAVGTYMAVKQHRETQREQEQLKNQLTAQQGEIARLLTQRSNLRKCADDEVPLADCNIDQTVAPTGDASKSADNVSFETSSQFEIQKQIQEQQGYIGKLRDEIFGLKQKMGAY